MEVHPNPLNISWHTAIHYVGGLPTDLTLRVLRSSKPVAYGSLDQRLMPFCRSFVWPLDPRVLRAFGLRPAALATAALGGVP